ncbi:hypothetical protein C7999DRAFT_18564 [Corynascus novoguineensis]|uniref:Uncharacterized protein n=1 Tax=Corynascus novoguineensis TaxID=1126955 RepID=A0AAN7CJ29_9PEZI|nr:hypothetical protein C7999DRAFT_18564 [Corynascus novoguineensis]
MPRGGSSAADPPKSGTAVASKPSGSPATLPTWPKKQKIDPRTKKPMVDAKGNPIY